MNNKIFTYVNFGNVTLDMCGLDEKYNILTAPTCKCGCGGKACLVLKNDEDVEDFCVTMLSEGDCEYSGIFYMFNNGITRVVIRSGNDIYGFTFNNLYGYEDFGEFVEESGLHCYGVIVELDYGLWKIVEE